MSGAGDGGELGQRRPSSSGREHVGIHLMGRREGLQLCWVEEELDFLDLRRRSERRGRA
jgi:hypothetical protein